jgi:hypothetical protein
LSARRKSWIALLTFFLVLALAANLPLAAGLSVLLLAFIGYAVFQATLKCPGCGSLLVRRQVAGITVYVPLAPHLCARCSYDLDSPLSRGK